MRKIISIIIVLLYGASVATAQKVEFSLGTSAGLFNFTGKSAASSSSVTEDYNGMGNHINNPLSTKSTINYGFSGQVQKVSASRFIIGLQAGYEVLRSKMSIDTVYRPVFSLFYNINTPNPYSIASKGQSILVENTISLNPYIGYRLSHGNYRLDPMPGIDIGFRLNSNVKGSATASDNTVHPVNYNIKELNRDTRLKLALAAGCKHYALTASYAHGISNYSAGDGGTAYSQLWRLGIAYRF
jgi:hypothetical protein